MKNNDRRQLALIADHLDAMIPDDVAERIGATKERALHIRVLRVVSDYVDAMELLKKISRIDVDGRSAEHVANLGHHYAVEARKILNPD